MNLFILHLNRDRLTFRFLGFRLNFIFDQFHDLLLSFIDQPLLVLTALSLLSTPLAAELLFLFSGLTTLIGFISTLASQLFLLTLMLAVLALTLHFFYTITLCFFFLLACLGLVPVELFQVLVLLGRVIALKERIDFLGVEVLLEADVNDLVVGQNLGMVFVRQILIVLHDIPLFFVELNYFFI